jgi:hypothetical protein
MKSIFLLFATIIIIIQFNRACLREASISDVASSIILPKDESKFLKLNSETLPYSKSIQFNCFEGLRLLSVTNRDRNSIYFYNYDTHELDYIWKPKDSLFNNFYLDGHSVLNRDTIIVFSYASATVCLSNRLGKCLNTYRLVRDMSNFSHPPTPVIGTFNPILLKDSLLLCTGYISGEYNDSDQEQRPVIIKFDINSNRIEYYLDYPHIYDRRNWGGCDLRNVYAIFFKNFIIASFPLSNNLIKFDLFSFLGSEIIAMNNFKFDPIHQSKDKIISHDALGMHFYSNFSYGPILYDKYRSLFYRIWYKPATNPRDHEPASWIRKWGIEIFNENFEICGNQQMDDSLFTIKSMFVTEEGINYQKFINDDEIMFSILKPEKISN